MEKIYFEQIDFGLCLEKGKRLLREKKFYEARAYLKRAYLIWPWNNEVKQLLQKVERELSLSEEGKHARD